MKNIFISAGLACVIAAIVTVLLKEMGVEHPAIFGGGIAGGVVGGIVPALQKRRDD